MPRWSELVIPTTLVSRSASQPAATRSLSLEAHLPRSAAALLSQCRTPVPQAFAPHLLQPKSTTILSVNTSEDFQLSTPKPPISCTLEPLTASVPHLPLPSLPNTFLSGFVPTTMPLHFHFFTLYGSICTQPDSALSTAGAQALLGSQLFYWFCALCCPSSKLRLPASIHCHVLTSHPSQPSSHLPRTLHAEGCSPFWFWQKFSKSEHRLCLPKICLALLRRN